MDEVMKKAKSLRIAAAILLLVTAILMTFGGVTFSDDTVEDQFDEILDEFDSFDDDEIDEVEEALDEAGINRSAQQVMKDMEAFVDAVEDGNISLFDLGFNLPRFMRCAKVVIQIDGSMDEDTELVLTLMTILQIAVYVTLGVYILYMLLLFLNKRTMSILPMILSIVWFLGFGLVSLASEDDASLHMFIVLGCLLSIVVCVLACVARKTDKALKGMGQNGYQQPYDIQNQYAGNYYNQPMSGQTYGNGQPMNNQAYGNGQPMNNQAYGNGQPMNNQAYGNNQSMDGQSYANSQDNQTSWGNNSNMNQ